tara:strand:+ start:2946 stop:4208 length:1263 start_codon:yes stop_codon:yes gene_type:complete
MIRYIPVLTLGLFFFSFLIGRVENAYDRIHPQFLFLAISNFLSLLYIFSTFSFEKISNAVKQNKTFLYYSIYIGISVISILFATNKIESLVVLSQYLTFMFSFLVILLIVKLYNLNFLKILIYFTIISLIIESIAVLYSVFDYVLINGNTFERLNVYRGFSGNVNITAFSLVIKSSFVYYILFKSKNSLRYDVFGFIILFFVSSALFFLLTRGAILAFIILNLFIISFLVISKHNHKIIRFKILFLLLTFISSYLTVGPIIRNDISSNLLLDRVSTISINTEDQSIGERLRFYNVSLKIISQRPLNGIGVGNWKFESIKYDVGNLEEYRVPYHAHNDFLQIASETGLLGLLAYLAIFIYPLKGLLRYLYNSKEKLLGICLIGAMGVYFIDSMLNFPIARPISHLYFIFILIGFESLTKSK